MGLLKEIFKIFDLGETSQDKDKRIHDKLFMDEAKAYGLTKEEIEECRKVELLLNNGLMIKINSCKV